MANNLTVLQFQDPFNPTCEEVRSHLQTYWMTPANLAVVSRAAIETHLGHCDHCQEVFVKLTEIMQPEWRKQ